MSRFSRPVVLVFALLLAPPGRGAEGWPVARGPSREPVPARFDRKMIDAAPREFLEDSAACVLYAGNTYLVEDDGTTEVITHDLTRLNGRKGVEKLGEYRNIVYDPSYQKLTLHEARIHKPDGRTVNVEPRHVQLRDVGTDYQVYDHEKQLIISFPTLQVGDVIEVKWAVRGKNPEYAGNFFTRYSFGDANYPVVLDDLRVRVPKSRTFHHASINGKLDPEVTRDGDQVTYHWKVPNCKRLPQDENLPSKEELSPAVACSTFASWEEVGRWKHKLREEAWQCTTDVAAIVREATTGLTDPAAKARALTYWLRRNIRYVSAGERHDYSPHPPATVLANRFGDCKDTSQMLAVMLREAGVKVELVTLGVRDDGQVIEEVPSPWGTHAILVATIDGKQHWIDTTASLAGWDFLPRDGRNRLCYVVDDRGSIRLDRTPPTTADSNRVEQATFVWIGTDGSTRCERTVVSYGSAAMGQRDTFLEVPVGERRRQVTSELQDANSRSRLGRLSLDEAALRDLDQPVTARLTFEVNNYFSSSGTEREGSFTDNKVWSKLLAFNLDYDRQVPLEFVAPFEAVHRYVVHLPAAYVLESVPKPHVVRSKWGVFSVKVKPVVGEATRVVDFEFRMRLERPRVEVEDFDEFRKFHEDVSHNYRVWLTLKPAQSLADAPLLEAVLALVPEDTANAAALAKLYQIHDRADDARRVLRRALVYAPDDIELWRLAVKAAKDPADEEEAQRELVRRFSDEAKHVIDLGAILINRGKQEEARKLLEPLTKKGAAADRAHAHYQLARSYYRRDELKEALAHLDAAVKVDEDAVNTVRAHMLRGQVLEEMGKWPEASAAFARALALDHESTAPLDSLVRLSLLEGKTSEALDYLRRYVLAVGDEPAGLLLAAETYLRIGHDDEALDLAGRALDGKFRAKAERTVGLVWLKRGDLKQAVAHLTEAEPGPAVYEALIRARVGLGELEQAEPALEAAEKIDKPADTLKEAISLARRAVQRRDELMAMLTDEQKYEARVVLGCLACVEALRQAGVPSGVAEERLAKLSAGAKLGPLCAWSARQALDRGKLTVAVAEAERAIALTPACAGGYYVRGRVRLERGADGAVADLTRAAELSHKKDADVLHALADALHRSGRLQDALTAQRAAVKLKPKDPEMAEQLAVFEKEAGQTGLEQK
jgi:tetratricopeptide (TPR) repeat protein